MFILFFLKKYSKVVQNNPANPRKMAENLGKKYILQKPKFCSLEKRQSLSF
jgi:hypothetical protein